MGRVMFTVFLLITTSFGLGIHAYYSFVVDNELIQAGSLICAIIGLLLIVKVWPDSGLRKMYAEYKNANQPSNF
jgi:hypothetical protein